MPRQEEDRGLGTRTVNGVGEKKPLTWDQSYLGVKLMRQWIPYQTKANNQINPDFSVFLHPLIP